MTRYAYLPLVLAPAFVLAPAPSVGDDRDDDDDGRRDEIELDEAAVFIEFNSTDGDFGIQFFWDGEAWVEMEVEGPDGDTVLEVEIAGNVAAQGLTEGFFESAEPSLDELSMEEFLERFPEGEYEFEGESQEGDELEGEAEFTHALPAPPANLWPEDGDRVNAWRTIVATFDPVVTDLHGAPLEPELYEVVVETEDDDLERIFTMIVDGDEENPSVTIPPEFLRPEGEYKLEVIVQEESGNRTISETVFYTF